jgi:hypothetical protein
MNKTYFLRKTLFVFLMFLFVFVSCNAQNKSNSKKTIDDLLKYLSNDFEVTIENIIPLFSIIGAIDGRNVYLDRSMVEIYKYDLSDKRQKAIIDEAEKTGIMTIIGRANPVVVNGSFILISYIDHPEREKLISSFMNF